MKYSKAFIKAWENHTGLDFEPDGQYSGGWEAAFLDFTAGWYACHKILCKCWELVPDKENKNIPEIKSANPYKPIEEG